MHVIQVNCHSFLLCEKFDEGYMGSESLTEALVTNGLQLQHEAVSG